MVTVGGELVAVRGARLVDVDLPEAGVWGADFTWTATDAAGVEQGESVRMTFSVLDAPTAVNTRRL